MAGIELNLERRADVLVLVGTFALLALVLIQDDVAAQIEQLGSEAPARRDAAEAELERIGTRAYPAVLNATQSRDPEIRDRARRLLTRPPFLAEEIARGRLDALATDRWAESVEHMLTLKPERLKVALESGLNQTEGDARFRAEQVLAIVSAAPRNGLKYGIVLETRVFEDVEPRGLEIWINISEKTLVIEDRHGRHALVSKSADLPFQRTMGYG